MELVYLFVSHIIALAGGFAYGRIVGFRDAQPQRDRKGKFIKRG